MQTGEERGQQRLWQTRVYRAGFVHAQGNENAAERIDYRGDAGVCRPDHGNAFLDGAHARDEEVLIGTARRRRPEPCIVGDIHEPAGQLRRGDFIRKQNFVADQRADRRRSREQMLCTQTSARSSAA